MTHIFVNKLKLLIVGLLEINANFWLNLLQCLQIPLSVGFEWDIRRTLPISIQLLRPGVMYRSLFPLCRRAVSLTKGWVFVMSGRRVVNRGWLKSIKQSFHNY